MDYMKVAIWSKATPTVLGRIRSGRDEALVGESVNKAEGEPSPVMTGESVGAFHGRGPAVEAGPVQPF